MSSAFKQDLKCRNKVIIFTQQQLKTSPLAIDGLFRVPKFCSVNARKTESCNISAGQLFQTLQPIYHATRGVITVHGCNSATPALVTMEIGILFVFPRPGMLRNRSVFEVKQFMGRSRFQEYVCGDKGTKCVWGHALNVANRYVYATQPNRDRILIISKVQMVVVDVRI